MFCCILFIFKSGVLSSTWLQIHCLHGGEVELWWIFTTNRFLIILPPSTLLEVCACLISWCLVYFALLDLLHSHIWNIITDVNRRQNSQNPGSMTVEFPFEKPNWVNCFVWVVPLRSFTVPEAAVSSNVNVLRNQQFQLFLLWADTLQYITSISHPRPRRHWQPPPPLATRPPSPTQRRESAYLGEKDRKDIKSLSIIF